MTYKRILKKELESQAKAYPVVTLTGPRQSGKTTLVKQTFPKKKYVNLEAPDIRELAETDPRGFLNSYPEGAILDEIQRAPKLLSYIQIIVDEADLKGMFILTGSHQLELNQAITQSLAGRTALLTLLPMSIAELLEAGFDLTLDEYLLKGGYPRIFKDQLDPFKAYRDYYQTYLERDLRQLIQLKDLSQFQKFIRLCAGRIGQLLNLESLSNEVGVSSNTIKHWISILEASFIIFRLQPYHENFGKRSIKSSKLYFIDVGLASYVLGISEKEQMERDPLRGNLVENLILLELLKERLNQGLDPQLYFFRDTHGHEVDVVFQSGRHLIPIEIKSSQTFTVDFLNQLKFFHHMVGDRFKEGYVIYNGEKEQSVSDYEIVNFKHASKIVNHKTILKR